jgi:hypothetical protein
VKITRAMRWSRLPTRSLKLSGTIILQVGGAHRQKPCPPYQVRIVSGIETIPEGIPNSSEKQPYANERPFRSVTLSEVPNGYCCVSYFLIIDIVLILVCFLRIDHDSPSEIGIKA